MGLSMSLLMSRKRSAFHNHAQNTPAATPQNSCIAGDIEVLDRLVNSQMTFTADLTPRIEPFLHSAYDILVGTQQSK